MNQKLFKKMLKKSNRTSMVDFFKWLEENPDFMELSEIEIEINFMIYMIAKYSYIEGLFADL
jgi:hypothetical protein